MSYKKKAIYLSIFALLLLLAQVWLPTRPHFIENYSSWIFKPFQSGRNAVFGLVPFSIGDILYLLAGIWLITGLAKWIYFIVRFRQHKWHFAHSLFRSINILLAIQIIFLLGYGGNYYKPALSEHWKLKVAGWDISNLARYDLFLVEKLNALAPHYEGKNFRTVDDSARQYFRRYTNSRTSLHGLNAKPSMFGYFMQYMGIQGYYNPFTGEAQVNRYLPSFMLPFVVCHEMAHQSGIAAEDDANLLSYALCTMTADTTFKYSGYFNLWLYTHARLKQVDSNLAIQQMALLNPLSLKQRDELREIRSQYRGVISDYSGQLYDGYLRLHNQKDGIKSYFKVALSAWAYEEQYAGKLKMILIP